MIRNDGSNVNSKYYQTNTLSQLCSNFKNNFFLFHHNVRSFNKNSDELFLMLSQLQTKPSVIILSETWFSEGCVSEIPGYYGYHTYREERRGGGISVYVLRSLKTVYLVDKSFIADHVETCTVSLHVAAVVIHVVGIYRPPDRNIHMSIVDLDTIISSFNSRDRVILAGDLNVDILNECQASEEFSNFCYAYGFEPLIVSPTSVHGNRGSCLDHIWVNHSQDVESGILDVDITDHFPIFAIFNLKLRDDSKFIKKFRDHSPQCLSNLRTLIVDSFENVGLNEDNVSMDVRLFSETLYNVYNSCCPLRSKMVSRQSLVKPWMSNKLMICINRKHSLFRGFKRGIIELSRYITYRNIVTDLVRRAKCNYYNSKFNACGVTTRDAWGTVNSLIGKGKKRMGNIYLESDGQAVVDVPEHFNSYFANIAIDINREIPMSDISPLNYMGDASRSSMFASPVTPLDVRRVIVALPNKPTSFQNVPIFIYKHLSELLSPVIADLFNMSIRSGIFPQCLKLARVVPVFKGGDSKYVGNYRPISILSTMSKIFEKLMYGKLMSFLSNTRVLSSHQYGFREGRSTSEAILEFLQHTYASLDAKKLEIGVFLDFAKAFDTVNHGVLLSKLDHIGIRGPVWRWFESYLSGREQYVSVNDSDSNSIQVRLGVPQGSNLGPLLFIIYINDMHACSDILRFVHFADDTTVFLAGKDIELVSGELNGALECVDRWTNANRLSLNVRKTSYMLFSDRVDMNEIEVKIAGKSIERVHEAKFLGVIIDDGLSFTPHVQALCKKLSRSVGVLGRIAAMIPLKAKLGVYYALVYSSVVYGVVSWGSTGMGNSKKIEALLKRARKHICYSEFDCTRVRRLLNFQSIYEYFAVSRFYEILESKHPIHLYEMIVALQPTHTHCTRFSSCYSFNLPLCNKVKYQKFFVFRSIVCWNGLPDQLKASPSKEIFKRNLKEFLISKQSDIE